MYILIVDTGHLDDGDDIVAKVLSLQCSATDHAHYEIESIINFKADEIDTLEELR